MKKTAQETVPCSSGNYYFYFIFFILQSTPYYPQCCAGNLQLWFQSSHQTDRRWGQCVGCVWIHSPAAEAVQLCNADIRDNFWAKWNGATDTNLFKSSCILFHLLYFHGGHYAFLYFHLNLVREDEGNGYFWISSPHFPGSKQTLGEGGAAMRCLDTDGLVAMALQYCVCFSCVIYSTYIDNNI